MRSISTGALLSESISKRYTLLPQFDFCITMLKECQTICVVDDEPSVCKALRRLLISAGFKVLTYGSCQEFLHSPSLVEPDLLVLDVQMPAMTGLELQDHLLASGREIPLLFISANGNARTKSTAIAAGAVAFFQKPVDDQDLLSAIHNSIGSATRRTEKHALKTQEECGDHKSYSTVIYGDYVCYD